MAIRWSREALAARIDSIERRASGDAFVAEVVAFADTLDPEDRKALQEVLLERADADRVFVDVPRRWRRRVGQDRPLLPGSPGNGADAGEERSADSERIP